MKNKKVIFTDLDQTLLKEEKDISEYTLSVIKACQKKGLKFVPATARILRVLERMNIVDMFPYDALICANGGKIYVDNKLIYNKGIERKELDDFLPSILEKYGDCRITIEMNETMYVNHNILEVDPYVKKYEISDLKNLPDLMIERMFIGLNDINQFTDLKKVLPDYIYAHTVENSPFCRIIHKDISKAKAIERLCQLWDIDIKDTICFGDDQNDIEMFKLCSTTVAVDNAIDELKKVATHTTKSNQEDGVASWLEKYILNS